MLIPLNDLKRHTASIRDEITTALARVALSGHFSQGPELSAFESAFASYCGIEHCIGVGNGSDALEIALRSIGICEGDLVATVANAGFYSSTAIAAIGATPVFLDVDRNTYLLSLDSLDRMAKKHQIKALIVTHLFGRMHDMESIMAFCSTHDILVVEDCAQSHGARRHGKTAGSFGAVSAYSFYPTKNLGALGDAGAVLTNSDDIAAVARAVRQYGWSSKYHSDQIGRNSRMDELQAAALAAKLPRLDVWNARRYEIASSYASSIQNQKVKITQGRPGEYVAHLVVLECAGRDSLKAHLLEFGISSDIHYPVPDHRQKSMKNRYFISDDLSATDYLAGRILTLPCFPELTDHEIKHVVDGVNSW